MGLALDKQDMNDESERAYNAATKIKENETLAWQGLITLYEKQAGRKVDEYHKAALHLAELFMKGYVRGPGMWKGRPQLMGWMV